MIAEGDDPALVIRAGNTWGRILGWAPQGKRQKIHAVVVTSDGRYISLRLKDVVQYIEERRRKRHGKK